jgi:P-type conjugative transfer protein TrbJ
MRIFFKNSFISLSIAAVVGGSAVYTPPVQAFACSNCASEATQALNYGQLFMSYLTQAEQLTTQMDQYEDMVKQGLGLSDSAFDSLSDDLQSLVSLYQSGKALAHRMSDLDEQFLNEFKGYENYLTSIGQGNINMPARYRQWAEFGLDNVRMAMRSAGMQTSILESEDAMLSRLVQRSATAQGRLQAIQAGNEIAAQQVQQLQKLREIMATQITLQGNWMATQVERQAVDDAFVENFKNGQVQHGESKGY